MSAQLLAEDNSFHTTMKLADIHAEVENMLKENPDKVTGRRQKMGAVKVGKELLEKSDVLKVLNELQSAFVCRRLAWISTDQTQTSEGRGSVKMQVLGINVGIWSIDSASKDISYRFHPDLKKFPDFTGEPLKWSKDLIDGKEMRDFLKKCEGYPRADKNSEREIQWRLANELLAPKKPKNHALGELGTVTWNGCFAEVGVAVTKNGSAEGKTGTLDLMVRRGKGFPRGFLVFELKSPGVKKVEEALQQALRYATALKYEANDGPGNQEIYNDVFESGARGKLSIGAVAVLEDNEKVRKRACEYLEQYERDRRDLATDPIGVLLYTISNDTIAWDWLDGWDARKPTLSAQRTAPRH